MDKLTLILLLVLLVALWVFSRPWEKFGLGPVSSTAFGWNVGTSYEQGAPESGYGLYGSWPGMIDNVPWKYWMWERRPLIFKTPFSLAPQIDYNYSPPKSLPVTNLNISIAGNQFMVNGIASPTLELDRNVKYYFHVNSPQTPFVIMDENGPVIDPVENGFVEVMFTDNDPKVLHYTSTVYPTMGNVIYLNDLK
jgi:hypothetical protein